MSKTHDLTLRLTEYLHTEGACASKVRRLVIRLCNRLAKTRKLTKPLRAMRLAARPVRHYRNKMLVL